LDIFDNPPNCYSSLV